MTTSQTPQPGADPGSGTRLLTAAGPPPCAPHSQHLPPVAATELAAAVVQARGAPQNWRAAPIRQGLACAVIDAITTPRVTVGTVDATVRRYEHRFGGGSCTDLVASFAELDGVSRENAHRSAGDGDAQSSGGPPGGTSTWRTQIATNHRTHASLDAPYKADVVLRAAQLLVEHDVNDSGALWARAHDASLRAAWCALPGQSSGASWRHLLLASGCTDVIVCPLARRFARRVLPRAVADGPDLLAVIAQAADLLSTTALDVEHQMWRAAVAAPVRAAGTTGPTTTVDVAEANVARTRIRLRPAATDLRDGGGDVSGETG